MPLRSPEPGTFEHLLKEVRLPASTLLRLSKYPATEPWWSRGAYRFDGPPSGTPGSFGTCYATQELAVAFAESTIHDDAWFRNGRYEVLDSDLRSRHIVGLQRPDRPELVLADFTGQALKGLGLNNDISSGTDYAPSMAWAKAVYHSDTKWDGIYYVSRQYNARHAVALFERSGVSAKGSLKLQGELLARLCDLFGVAAV